MFKNIIISSLAAFTLLMSGCGNNEAESKLQTQQMLDNGNFQGVIDKLKSTANSKDDYVLLASAYMGKSGLTLANLLSTISDTSGGSGSSGFAGFATSLASSISPTAITDLNSAIANYRKVANGVCASKGANLTSFQKNICLYIGLASTGSAAATIDLITGDIASFGTGASNDKLTASVCAMEYVNNQSLDGNCTASLASSDVTFIQSQKTYRPFSITVLGNSNPFDFLKTDINQSALTKGYCTLSDFSTRTEIDSGASDYYVCPVNETTGSDLTTTGVLVDILNTGLDAVASATDANVQENIDQYKCEILGGNYSSGSCISNTNSGTSISLDTNITATQITDYLTAQNK